MLQSFQLLFLLRHERVWAGPVDSPPCSRCSCERWGRSKRGHADLLCGEGGGEGAKGYSQCCLCSYQARRKAVGTGGKSTSEMKEAGSE